MFLMRRRAWWSALKIFFATVLGITHRGAARVSKSLCQLFYVIFNFKLLKHFLKMLESGIDPATVLFEAETKYNTFTVYLFGSSCHFPRNDRAPEEIYCIFVESRFL